LHSEQERADFVALRASGKSLAACAEALSVSKSTATAWARELAAQITPARRAYLEEIAETYAISKAARVRRLGELIARVDAEIAGRDLGEIATPSLLLLRANLGKLARDEMADLERPATETETPKATGRDLVALFGRPPTAPDEPDENGGEP
jgi:transcriptional regulator with XRE-family HTH domain